MPSKKKKYNARFPAGRIKRIMQSDEEVGKVAQAVPIIIFVLCICGLIFFIIFSCLPRTLELFVESLLTKTLKITNSRNAKTLSTSHMKQCIMSEQRFDFLRELVRNIPDISVAEEAANYNEEDNQSSPEEQYADSDTPFDLSMPSTSVRSTSATNTRRHQQLAYQYQQHQQHASNGQNGGSANDHHRNILKRSISSNPSSVIMHTMSLANASSGYSSTEHLPSKLSRSESNPVPSQRLKAAAVHPPRLKHQSYSIPTNNIDLTNNSNKPNIHPKTLRTPSQQTTAIPAPIVSIDYCSKPVVKIDYSNLPLTAGASAPPLSAPAHIASMSGSDSAFNFNAEPVINIDLSNMVATGSATNVSTPPMATISIGNNLKATQQSRNSKATTMAEPSYSSLSFNTIAKTAQVVPTALMMPSTATTSSGCGDSTLELDEDYDNI